jgi:hypothetical protein
MSDIDNFDEPEHENDKPLFTAKELADIKAKAREEIMADKKAAAKKDLIAGEKQRLQREEGLTTGNGHMDQIVSIHIDLAPYAPNILVNGHPYWHGKQYTVPRHVAISLQETMFNTWRQESIRKGESYSEFYAQKHVDELYRVGKSLGTFSARGM